MFKTVMLMLLIVSYSIATSSFKKSNYEVEQKELTRVCDVPDNDKAKLFSKCLSWVAKNYNSANTVIQNKDLETGEIVLQCSGSFVYALYDRHYKYTAVISVKDNKIRVQYPNIIGERVGNVYPPDFKYQRQWEPVKTALDGITTSLFDYVKTETPVEQQDW